MTWRTIQKTTAKAFGGPPVHLAIGGGAAEFVLVCLLGAFLPPRNPERRYGMARSPRIAANRDGVPTGTPYASTTGHGFE